jgi:hypothetical protein
MSRTQNEKQEEKDNPELKTTPSSVTGNDLVVITFTSPSV